jgi:hypothetical protein
VISLIALGLAFALFVAHLLDGRMPRGYVLAAFIASAIIAAGDIREYAGQVCTTATVDGETRTTCTVQYTVKSEALMAFIASVGFVALALFLEFFERLGRAVGGWDV